jgi:hypothetical protein
MLFKPRISIIGRRYVVKPRKTWANEAEIDRREVLEMRKWEPT